MTEQNAAAVQNERWRRQRFEKFSAGLSADARAALWRLLESDVWVNSFELRGNDAALAVDDCAAFRRTVVLLNATGIPENEADCLCFSDGSLIFQDGEYRLIGEAMDYENDTAAPFAVRFTDAKVELALFRADVQTFAGDPWTHLQLISSEILEKRTLPGCAFNEKEQALLPLLSQISRLSYWLDPAEEAAPDFSLLKTYAAELGYSKLLPLFEKLEKVYPNEKKRSRQIRLLVSKLNERNYEPFWQKLYAQIIQSQAEYPSKAHACCPPDILAAARTEIQRLMECHGYTGVYPDFVKTGPIRGIRLAESYDMTYFVGMEKNAVFRIHCTEDFFNGHLMIEFLCGTALLRKNESAGDIFVCLFNANGRRLFQTVSYESGYINEDGMIGSDDLAQRVQIAVKKAELKKLTREERKAFIGFDLPYWQLFLSAFIIMGGLFGLFMTLGFMLIAVVMALLIGQPETIPAVFTDIPWWACFVLSWVLFGGAMGIVTVLAKRK